MLEIDVIEKMGRINCGTLCGALEWRALEFLNEQPDMRTIQNVQLAVPCTVRL